MSTFSDDERAIAQQLCKSQATVAFLTKLFTPDTEPTEEVLAKNVVALDDAKYGRLMKVLYLSRLSFEKKMDTLKLLGRTPSVKGTPGAKR